MDELLRKKKSQTNLKVKTLSKNAVQHRKKEGYQEILCKDLQNVRNPMLPSASSEEGQKHEPEKCLNTLVVSTTYGRDTILKQDKYWMPLLQSD